MSNETQLSKYHDAEIMEIKCSNLDKELELSFKLVNGVETIISFSGCQFYRIDGMWKQNVVYRIRNTSIGAMDQSEILAMLHHMTRNDSQISSLPTDHIKLWLNSIINGDLILSMIEPSTGAEFMTLSKSMDEVKLYDP